MEDRGQDPLNVKPCRLYGGSGRQWAISLLTDVSSAHQERCARHGARNSVMGWITQACLRGEYEIFMPSCLLIWLFPQRLSTCALTVTGRGRATVQDSLQRSPVWSQAPPAPSKSHGVAWPLLPVSRTLRWTQSKQASRSRCHADGSSSRAHAGQMDRSWRALK